LIKSGSFRRADVCLAEISDVKEGEQVATEPVGQHQAILFCRRGHPLLERKSLSKSDLGSYPLVAIRLPSRVAELFPGKSKIEKTAAA
jgi:DNA-binding transcriptional LysR family regulator